MFISRFRNLEIKLAEKIAFGNNLYRMWSDSFLNSKSHSLVFGIPLKSTLTEILDSFLDAEWLRIQQL